MEKVTLALFPSSASVAFRSTTTVPRGTSCDAHSRLGEREREREKQRDKQRVALKQQQYFEEHPAINMRN